MNSRKVSKALTALQAISPAWHKLCAVTEVVETAPPPGSPPGLVAWSDEARVYLNSSALKGLPRKHLMFLLGTEITHRTKIL